MKNEGRGTSAALGRGTMKIRRAEGEKSRKQMRRAKPFVSRPLRSSPQRPQRNLPFLSCLIVREIDTIRHGTSHEFRSP